ncbi:hypothetical protein [Pseudarthrobacter sulfonivorans]|uniref:hypothetical protein n=1 Tax=Pseudarthrobacter sulfonivorans TaxID=121292 RepID=UPI002858DCE2|nr:hypothetical protein [Pseudarthrobacter sulfonivorans]MDR6417276.1 hypothetical protein [Pseudarthrobacter sulfonivorans]
MENLFSHSEDALSGHTVPAESLEPVVYTVTVPGPVAQAFAGFTDHTHLWWPMESNSVFGTGSYVEFEDILVLETADDGRTAVWGSLDDWQPPLSFHASWYPGTTALWSTELRVAFRAVPEGTEVRLVHDGWEGAEDPAATRAASAESWPAVLDRFVRFMGGTGSEPR